MELTKKRKAILLLTCLQLLTITSVVFAQNASVWFHMPSTATPTGNEPELDFTIFVNGQFWPNATIVDWGDVEAGQTYTKSVTIQNDGASAFIAQIIVEDLPADWILTFSMNSTEVMPQNQIIGYLQLTTPDPMPQTTEQNWDMFFVPEATT